MVVEGEPDRCHKSELAGHIGGGWSLQMSMTDKGEPGKDDTIAVTLWNGSTLVFSSNWNGAKTVEQILGGGNLVVH